MAETTAITVQTIMNEQPGTSICSIQPEPGNKDKVKTIFNAMNNPTHQLREFVNKKVIVENVLIEVNNMFNDETGEVDKVPRTVLISPDGTSYSATSKGVFTSIKNAYVALGAAPWEGGVEFEVKQKAVGRGQMLTLEMV